MADPRGQLLAVLHDAASQQPEKLKGAQQQLKQWETSPDFYATLQVSWTLGHSYNVCWLWNRILSNLLTVLAHRTYFMIVRCLSILDLLLVYIWKMVLMLIGERQQRSRLSNERSGNRRLLGIHPDPYFINFYKVPYAQKSEHKFEAGYWLPWMKKTNR